MGKTGKKDSFILQAGILAAAGIICRLIGLLYRGPLTAVIGDEGNGYYQAAYNIYTIILLISSYSIPSAISKVIAQKLSLREYRNAHRIFICSMWYVLAVGGAASLFLFFGAGLLVEGPAVTVLRVFAPTIFLYGILGVLRGYFQAHKTMVQTSVSQILEQILNASVSIGAAYMLIFTTLGTADTYVLNEDHTVSLGGQAVEEAAQQALGEDGQPLLTPEGEYVYVLTEAQQAWNTQSATYGAMGSALGTGAGVITALLFMWAVYGMNKRTIYRRMDKDRCEYVDSYGQIFRILTSVVIPFILSTAIYNLSTVLNQTIYTKMYMYLKGAGETETFTKYGIFSGKAAVITNIPIALSTAMSSAVLPSISTAYAQGDWDGAREKVAQAIKTTMLISIPAAVGMGVLAEPVILFLFPQKASAQTAAGLLTALSATVIFYVLSTLTNSVLQGIGKVNIPVKNAGISLMLQTAVLSLLIYFTELDLYTLVVANMVYSGAMCIFNQIAVRKYLDYRQEIFRTYVTPLTASAFMGIAAWGVYQGLHYFIGSNRIALLLTIAVAAVIYFVLEIALKGITEQELRRLPKGYVLVKAAKKCRLM